MDQQALPGGDLCILMFQFTGSFLAIVQIVQDTKLGHLTVEGIIVNSRIHFQYLFIYLDRFFQLSATAQNLHFQRHHIQIATQSQRIIDRRQCQAVISGLYIIESFGLIKGEFYKDAQ